MQVETELHIGGYNFELLSLFLWNLVYKGRKKPAYLAWMLSGLQSLKIKKIRLADGKIVITELTKKQKSILSALGLSA